jgi:hypothetical protein
VEERNMIRVTIGDLAEEDQHRIKEENEVTKLHEKLAWYQKMRNKVMQKADTARASSSKINPPSHTPEELVHLVDIFVASKYGADLAQ